MVWYQKFEYAIGHWLQKAAEHMLGCVLCSPGCFSLFRGSAIMDDNVMRTYATKSTEARHYVQYDQGKITYSIHYSQMFGTASAERSQLGIESRNHKIIITFLNTIRCESVLYNI